MRELFTILGSAVGVGLLLYTLRTQQLRQTMLRRLGAREEETTEIAIREPPTDRPILVRRRWVAWVTGLLLFILLFFLTKIGLTFSVTFGVMSVLLVSRIESWWATQRQLLLETQLAEALDLMISSLNAGGGVLSALDNAARETRAPLRALLQELLARIRYGDDPQQVMRTLEQRIPLETVRLFCSALSVHWEVGGSLAPVLATVGRTIRDRIELSRRLRSLTAQSRYSTGAILATTYFIGLVVWRNDPERMESFLRTSIGQGLVATALLLQALGIVWSASLSKLRY